MLRHVVLFRWDPAATDDQRAAVLDGLAAMPDAIAEIRSYEFGADLGLSEGGWDLALVAEFDDADAYRTYRDHPAHRELVETLIHPILREVARVQHEVAPPP